LNTELDIRSYVLVFIALKQIKAILDKRLRAKNFYLGWFSAKPRVDSTLSTLPPPFNPVKWAVKRYKHVYGTAFVISLILGIWMMITEI